MQKKLPARPMNSGDGSVLHALPPVVMTGGAAAQPGHPVCPPALLTRAQNMNSYAARTTISIPANWVAGLRRRAPGYDDEWF